MRRLALQGAVCLVGAGLFAATALAWTGATTTPPGGNTASPINTSATQQTKSGDIWSTTSFVAPNVTANQFCIGTSCISNWSGAGSQVWTDSGRGSGFNYNTLPSATAQAGSDRWVDGGTANSNGPINGGNSTGILVQIDPLWSGQPDANKMQFAVPYDGNLYWRSEYGGVWNGWFSLVQANAAGNVGIGNTNPAYKLDVSGDIRANNGWLRTDGNTGWYSDTYGGGWFMQDSTWIRSYNGKPVFMAGGFDTSGASSVGCGGSLGNGYSFGVCGSIDATNGTYTSNWFRVNDNSGLYWQNYGTSVQSVDSSWVRANPNIYTNGGYDSGGSSGAGCGGGLGAGYTFRVCGSEVVTGDIYDGTAGKWLSQGGFGTSNFGGAYFMVFNPSGSCVSGDPYTGGCGCPSGFSAQDSQTNWGANPSEHMYLCYR